MISGNSATQEAQNGHIHQEQLTWGAPVVTDLVSTMSELQYNDQCLELHFGPDAFPRMASPRATECRTCVDAWRRASAGRSPIWKARTAMPTAVTSRQTRTVRADAPIDSSTYSTSGLVPQRL